MEPMELMKQDSAEMLEKVLVNGDLSSLTAPQRLDYYKQVCQSCGLNPLTKPFDYIRLNGKLTLYARKDATDQLRKIHSVSIDDISREYLDDLIIVTVKGHDATGRTDVEVGVVSRKDMQGNFANALMKANTKAKRRLTLSICGLGWLDETEVESIPDARPVVVDANTGEILPQRERAVPAPKGSTSAENPAEAQEAFDENTFLLKFHRPEGLPYIAPAKAKNEVDRDGNAYGTIPTQTLVYRMNALMKSLNRPDLTQEQRDERQYKLSVICSVLADRASTMILGDGDEEK